MIEDFRFGAMKVGGRIHSTDLKIVAGKVVDGWWRREGHTVNPEDVDDILGYEPEVLVVGTGDPGRMHVDPELRAALAEARIDLMEEPTPRAVQTFNRLLQEGRKVAGAFHLTC